MPSSSVGAPASTRTPGRLSVVCGRCARAAKESEAETALAREGAADVLGRRREDEAEPGEGAALVTGDLVGQDDGLSLPASAPNMCEASTTFEGGPLNPISKNKLKNGCARGSGAD